MRGRGLPHLNNECGVFEHPKILFHQVVESTVFSLFGGAMHVGSGGCICLL